jgi:hypothetical protein
MSIWLALLAVAGPSTSGGGAEPPRELPDGLEMHAIPLANMREVVGDGSRIQAESRRASTAAKPATGPYRVPYPWAANGTRDNSDSRESLESLDERRATLAVDAAPPEDQEAYEAPESESESELESDYGSSSGTDFASERRSEPDGGPGTAQILESDQGFESKQGILSETEARSEWDGGSEAESEAVSIGEDAVADPLVAPSSVSFQEGRRFAVVDDGERNERGEAGDGNKPQPILSFNGLGSRGGLRYALMGCSALCALLLARKWFRERQAESQYEEESSDERGEFAESDSDSQRSEDENALREAEELTFVEEQLPDESPRVMAGRRTDTDTVDHQNLASVVAAYRRRGGSEHPSTAGKPSPVPRAVARKRSAKRAASPVTQPVDSAPSPERLRRRGRWRFLLPRISLSLPSCASRAALEREQRSPISGAAQTATTDSASSVASAPAQKPASAPVAATSSATTSATPTPPAATQAANSPTIIVLSPSMSSASTPTMVPGYMGTVLGPAYGGGFTAGGFVNGMPGVGPSPWEQSARSWGGSGPWGPAFPAQGFTPNMPMAQAYPVPSPYQVPVQVPVPVQIPVPVHLPIPMPIPYASVAVAPAPTVCPEPRRDGSVPPTS